MREIKIDPTWKKVLAPEFEKAYWESLTTFVREEYRTQTIYPAAQKSTAPPYPDASRWDVQALPRVLRGMHATSEAVAAV